MATPKMNIDKPTVGGSEDTWGTELNDALDTIDSHDHTSSKGAQVPTSGLNIDDDLEFDSNHITGVRAVEFNTNDSIGSLIRSLAVKDSDSELYFINSSGQEVKITSGTGLDISSSGGFTGDYETDTNAEARYTTASTLYEFFSDTSSSAYGTVRASEADIRETSGDNGVKIGPHSSTNSYSITLLESLPADTQFVTIDSSGQLKTRSQSETMTLTPAMAAADVSSTNDGLSIQLNASGTIMTAVPLKEGDIITGVHVWVQENGASFPMKLNLVKVDLSSAGTQDLSDAEEDVGTTKSTTGDGNSTWTQYEVADVNETVTADHLYSVRATGASDQKISLVQIDYKR